MTTRTLSYALAVSTALTTTSLISVPSFAQEQSSLVLEEIVVTSRKREENLFEVPISVTAITELQIERTGADNLVDIANQTPGFSFRQGFGRTGSGQGGGSSNRPSLRGQTNILGQPTVGFFVDGVYVAGNVTSYQIDNLERVEIVKGPQSALFGRGTFAGAVSLVTRRPDNEFRGKAEFTAGYHDRFEGSASVSGPLIEDKLFVELNGRYFTFGGDYFNEITQEIDGGDQRTFNFGGKIVATPNENLEITVGINYADDQDKGFAEGFIGSDNLNCFLPVETGSFFGIPLTATRAQGYFCGEVEIPDLFVYDNTRIEAAGFHGLDRQVLRSFARVDYEFDNQWSITSIGSYNTSDNTQALDIGSSQNFLAGADPLFSVSDNGVNDWSVELKLASPQDTAIRGFGGVYFYKETNQSGFDSDLETANGVFDPATDTPADVIIDPFDDGSNVRNWAVFGHLEYDVTDQITLTVEGRYQEDRLQEDSNFDGRITIEDATTLDVGETFTAFLPRFSIAYQTENEWNIYASAAKGNRPGGFNVLPNSATAEARTLFNEDFLSYDEDTVWQYELGAKGRFWDGRASFEGSLFYTDWTNQQLTEGIFYERTGTSPTTFPAIVNIGESRIMGAEFDLNAQLTEWMSVRIGYGLADTKIKDFLDTVDEDLRDTDGLIGADDLAGDPTGQVAGNELPQTPKHTLNLSANIQAPTGYLDGIDFFIRPDLSYESKRWTQVHNEQHTGDSYNLNLRTGFESDDWTFTFFVNNLTDDDTPVVVTRLLDFQRPLLMPDPVRSFIFLQNRRFSFFRDFRVAYPRRRAWGVTVNYKF